MWPATSSPLVRATEVVVLDPADPVVETGSDLMVLARARSRIECPLLFLAFLTDPGEPGVGGLMEVKGGCWGCCWGKKDCGPRWCGEISGSLFVLLGRWASGEEKLRAWAAAAASRLWLALPPPDGDTFGGPFEAGDITWIRKTNYETFWFYIHITVVFQFVKYLRKYLLAYWIPRSYVLVEYWEMYWLRLEDGVACLHGMGGSSHCCRHCWMALTEMEMILDWERGNHYAVVVVAAAVAEDVVGLAKVASGRIEAVQGSRRPRRLGPCCCQWIRSSREGHCLNITKKT